MEILKHCQRIVSQNPTFRGNMSFGKATLSQTAKDAVQEVKDILDDLVDRQQDQTQACSRRLAAKTGLAAIKKSKKAIQQAQNMRYVRAIFVN